MIPKFRAWDKETQSLRYVLVVDWLNNLVDLDSGLIERQFDEIELMQSTGLKDKNGVEIFEGDIVEIEMNDGFDYGSFIGQVEFLEGAWMINNKVNFARNLWSETGESEILGNIYANPELLEKQTIKDGIKGLGRRCFVVKSSIIYQCKR